MANVIRCKDCGAEIEISEALRHEVSEQIKKEVHGEIEEAIRKELTEKSSLDLEDLKRQLDEQKEKNRALNEKELELRTEKRKIEEAKKELELSVERRVDEERKKILEKAAQEEEEKYRLKNKEKDEQIGNLQRMLEEANRKASQASQQTQGEVMEVDLEERLRSAFPHDEISPVSKGIRGGDILQIVRNNYGKVAGSILWETKRATWSPSWLPKLREDARTAGASSSVLVTEQLPKDIKNFGLTDSVLVCSYAFVIPLAVILRRNLMQIAAAKNSTANKDEKLEMLYQYLQSDSFRHRFEAHVESLITMQKDLDYERRTADKNYKKREMQIRRAEKNMANLYGELQGIIPTLPDIRPLSLPEGEDEESDDPQLQESLL